MYLSTRRIDPNCVDDLKLLPDLNDDTSETTTEPRLSNSSNNVDRLFVTIWIVILSLQAIVDNNLTSNLSLFMNKSCRISLVNASTLTDLYVIAMATMRLVASYCRSPRNVAYLFELNLVASTAGLAMLWKVSTETVTIPSQGQLAVALLVCAVGQFGSIALQDALLNTKMFKNHRICLILQMCTSVAFIGNSSIVGFCLDSRPQILWLTIISFVLVQAVFLFVVKSIVCSERSKVIDSNKLVNSD
jgi:hypothetical protein